MAYQQFSYFPVHQGLSTLSIFHLQAAFRLAPQLQSSQARFALLHSLLQMYPPPKIAIEIARTK